MNFLIIFIVFILYSCIIILLSNLYININNIDIFYYKKKYYINDIDILISIKFLKLIPLKLVRIKKDNLKILFIMFNIKNKNNGINNPVLDFILLNRKKFKILHPHLKKMDLKIGLGSEIMPLTILSIPVITSSITYILNKYVLIKKRESINYKIIPKYNNNTFSLIINSIMTIDIINMLYFISIKKQKH